MKNTILPRTRRNFCKRLTFVALLASIALLRYNQEKALSSILLASFDRKNSTVTVIEHLSDTDSVSYNEHTPSPTLPSTPNPTPTPPLIDPSQQRSILYIHVGKTGGMTLRSVFPASCNWHTNGSYKRKCLENISRNKQSILADLVKFEFHMDRNKPRGKLPAFKDQNATTFLFTVRNPLSRFVSAFNMYHMSNIHYRASEKRKHGPLSIFCEDCFPTVEDMALILDGSEKREALNEKNETVDCFRLAIDAIMHGNLHGVNHWHLMQNYDWYYSWTAQMYPEREIMAMRTENLWEDLTDIDEALGGEKDAFINVTDINMDHAKTSYKVSSGLSDTGKKTICCYMYKEVEIYENIMKSAVNLKESVKEESLEKIYRECGLDYQELRGQNFTWYEWAKEKSCTDEYESITQ